MILNHHHVVVVRSYHTKFIWKKHHKSKADLKPGNEPQIRFYGILYDYASSSEMHSYSRLPKPISAAHSTV